MASPVQLYQKEMHDNIGFFANWFPGDPLEVGDAGVLEGGRFRRLASLEELGILYELDADARPRQDVRYTSSSGVKVSPEVGADVAGLADGTISIEFSRSGAFLFHASSLRVRTLASRVEVEHQLRVAFDEGRWRKEWMLVDGIHVADHAIILVSQDKATGITLAAKVAGDLVGLSLADPRVSLDVVAMRGTVVHTVGRRDLHPLYSCVHMKDPLFGAPRMQPVRGPEGPPDGTFSRPAIDQLLNS